MRLLGLYTDPTSLPDSPELRRERWLRSQQIDVGHVVRVLPALPDGQEEILFLSSSGDPETALVDEEGSVCVLCGW